MTSWRPGDPVVNLTLTHVDAVLPDRVLADAWVVVRDGRVAEIGTGARDGDVDARGALLVPGLIDVHSDALEREREPRPNAAVPEDFALQTYAATVAGAGITTAFHGIGFYPFSASRSVGIAVEACGTIDAAVKDVVDHRVLHRLDLTSQEGADALRERMDALEGGGHLVSHEDHTPGQGQYTDRTQLEHYLVARTGLSPEEAVAEVDERIRHGAESAALQAELLEWLGRLAGEGRIRLLGHDPDSPEAIDALQARGGAAAEFPTTLPAARRAAEIGMDVIAGAPNALRGRSHNNNVSARELVADGLVDALASDYLPHSLLGAVTELVRYGLADLPQAVALVTSGPARIVGLDDRGSLREGALADLALLDASGRWLRTLATFTSAVR